MSNKNYSDGDNRLLIRAGELRLKSLHERLDAVFSENPESHVLSDLSSYYESVQNVKKNNVLFLEYVSSLDDEDVFIVTKRQLLSLLLLDDKKEDAKETDKNYVLIFEYLCSEKTSKDLKDSLSAFDTGQLQFIRKYSSYNIVDGPRVNKSIIALFVELSSHYRLNDDQRNKVYESLIDGKDYSIDEILTIEDPETAETL